MNDFNEIVKQHVKTLKLYVPIVDRVHGELHPEFHDVKLVVERLLPKLKKADTADLGDDFRELRRITSDYRVPDDVCESYEAVYQMLAQLDSAYQAKA